MGALELEIRCATCGAVAMRLMTTVAGDRMPPALGGAGEEQRYPAPGEGVATAVGGTTTRGSLGAWSGAEKAATEPAMRAGDVRALLRLDPELVPLFCELCGVVYCWDHWTLWDEFDPDDPSWYDETRGRCPEDHERRIYD